MCTVTPGLGRWSRDLWPSLVSHLAQSESSRSSERQPPNKTKHPKTKVNGHPRKHTQPRVTSYLRMLQAPSHKSTHTQPALSRRVKDRVSEQKYWSFCLFVGKNVFEKGHWELVIGCSWEGTVCQGFFTLPAEPSECSKYLKCVELKSQGVSLAPPTGASDDSVASVGDAYVRIFTGDWERKALWIS